MVSEINRLAKTISNIFDIYKRKRRFWDDNYPKIGQQISELQETKKYW